MCSTGVVRREHRWCAPQRPERQNRHRQRPRELEGDARSRGAQRLRGDQAQGVHLLGHRPLALAAGACHPLQRQQRSRCLYLFEGKI